MKKNIVFHGGLASDLSSQFTVDSFSALYLSVDSGLRRGFAGDEEKKKRKMLI